MPIQIERLPDEPIVIAKLIATVDVEQVKDMFATCGKIADEVDHLYRISDLSKMDTTFTELMLMMAEAAKGGSGRSGDPRITAVLVGINLWTRIASDGLKQEQYGKINLPVFETLDQALVHMRGLLAEKKAAEKKTAVS